ncbi:hypothetical protein HDU91_001773 [Kappamyces sp. JEL0680]|nr:hypothetical protein HDU91_001773 [Kappamyces sp. JEL0680]
MKTKRRIPVTERAIPRIKNTQKVISTFHTLTKELEKKRQAGDVEEVQSIERKIKEIGGLQTYQIASLSGGSKDKGWGGSGRWLLQQLVQHPLAQLGSGERLRMLDVGAITGEVYTKAKQLDVTSIDLNSQSPRVVQQDFFHRPLPHDDGERFHILGLSLVINFVTEPLMRGKMLELTRHHLLLQGYLYIVLPLPCVVNSRYLTHESFLKMLDSLGYGLVVHHHSQKLAYYLFRLLSRAPTAESFPKKEVASGAKRNNFCIAF